MLKQSLNHYFFKIHSNFYWYLIWWRKAYLENGLEMKASLFTEAIAFDIFVSRDKFKTCFLQEDRKHLIELLIGVLN